MSLNKFLYVYISYLININIKVRIVEKFNNFIYIDLVNFGMVMLIIEYCIF